AKVVLVEHSHHLHHLSCGHLAWTRIKSVVLPFGIVGSVAILARHSQGCRKNAHRAHKFVRRDAFKNLHVFEDFFCKLGFLSERRNLGQEEPYKTQNNVRAFHHEGFTDPAFYSWFLRKTVQLLSERQHFESHKIGENRRSSVCNQAKSSRDHSP